MASSPPPLAPQASRQFVSWLREQRLSVAFTACQSRKLFLLGHCNDGRTGNVVHSVTIEGVVRELYDVAILPGILRASALGFKIDEIRRTITMEE
jgi:hypothetical protein